MILYGLTRSPHCLYAYYFLRSLSHGRPIGRGLRLGHENGNAFIFPYWEDSIYEDIYSREVYRPLVVAENDVVVDVGAHMGLFTIKVASDAAKVVAIEPDTFNFNFLMGNLRLNHVQNVIPLNIAAGGENETGFLLHVPISSRSRISISSTGVPVLVRTLDTILEELGIRPTWIKIDAEGWELRILQGARRTISTAKPRLVIASYHYPQEWKEIASFLTSQGYSCQLYEIAYTMQCSRDKYILASATNQKFPK